MLYNFIFAFSNFITSVIAKFYFYFFSKCISIKSIIIIPAIFLILSCKIISDTDSKLIFIDTSSKFSPFVFSPFESIAYNDSASCLKNSLLILNTFFD